MTQEIVHEKSPAGNASGAAAQLERTFGDPREYACMVLENGLTALAIHDPLSDVSAAALAVEVRTARRDARVDGSFIFIRASASDDAGLLPETDGLAVAPHFEEVQRLVIIE